MENRRFRWGQELGILVAIICYAGLGLGVQAQTGGGGPLQVFILAGQSNMEGHGYAERPDWLPVFDRPQASLSNLVKHPVHGKEFERYLAGGKYVVRKDVWCHFRRSDQDMVGELKVGFGAHDTARAWTMGPELGFGWVIGDSIQSQVLLIKTAWGGKSLAKDFRPPGSGGTTGEYYLKMISQVKEILGDLKKHFPAYNGQGYKLAGFGWHQGWNDLVNTAFVDEYEKNMANLIRDIRKDLGAPGLPVVIAESGMACYDANNATAQKLCAAQIAPAGYPEFNGTVAAVRTRDFYDTSLSPWKAWGFHWHGSFYSYGRVGRGMGEAMGKLLPRGPTSAGPVRADSRMGGASRVGDYLVWNRDAKVGIWSLRGQWIGSWTRALPARKTKGDGFWPSP